MTSPGGHDRAHRARRPDDRSPPRPSASPVATMTTTSALVEFGEQARLDPVGVHAAAPTPIRRPDVADGPGKREEPGMCPTGRRRCARTIASAPVVEPDDACSPAAA